MIVTLYADPGECTGASLAHDRQLIWCGVLSLHHDLPWSYVDRLVIEIPNAHESKGAKRSKRDPQSIITLAITCGQWIRHVSAQDTVRKFPSTWKGQVPKAIHNERVLSCLTPGELALIPKLPHSKLHNVIDSLGLYLEDTGRMVRGRAA